MQSKTSFFNKTIFFKNITRYWPIWTAFLLVCLFNLPIRLYSALDVSATDITDLDALRLSQLEDVVYTALQPFPFFLFAGITAIAVFSYLYQARSAYMIHSLPVCRESLFLTNVLSGVCFLVISQIIAFLAGVFVCFLQHMTQLEYLMHWLILSLEMSLFAFALAVLTVMITGNIIAAPIFFFMINYLFVACRGIIASFMEQLSFGIESATLDFGSFLSPYYYISSRFCGYFSMLFTDCRQKITLPEAYPFMSGYFLSGIPILIIAFLIYKRKHLETTGDIITLPFLKPLFRWGAAFCVGSCIGIFGQYFFIPEKRNGENLIPLLILMIIGGALAFFLTEMILQKKFFVFCKKRCAECGIFLVLSVALVIGIDLNIFGIETRIPAEEEIASVYFNGSYPIYPEKEDFDKVLSIHQKLIDSKDEIEDYFRKYSKTINYSTLELIYTLKDGSTISRSYSIPVEDYYLEQGDYVFHQIEALTNDPEYYLQYHFTDAYESVTFIDGTLELYTGNEYFESSVLNQEQCEQIYGAFKQDVLEGNYRIYDYSVYDKVSDKIYYNSLYISYSVPQGSSPSYDGTADTVYGKNELQYTRITLTTDCVHTLQALDEMGLVDEEHRMITQKEADGIFGE